MLEQGMDAKTWFKPPPSLFALPGASEHTRQQAYYIAGRAISRILGVIDLGRHAEHNPGDHPCFQIRSDDRGARRTNDDGHHCTSQWASSWLGLRQIALR